MNKPQNLPVEGTPFKKSKIKLYKDSLIYLLSDASHSNPVVLFADQLVQSSTIIVFTPLSGNQLIQLANFANTWNQEIMIEVSPFPGIKIEFNLKQK